MTYLLVDFNERLRELRAKTRAITPSFRVLCASRREFLIKRFLSHYIKPAAGSYEAFD